MVKITRNWDLLSEEKRNEYIRDLIDFFDTEGYEKIGLITAENILDHFLQTVGINLYNKGVESVIEFFSDHVEDMKIDMESLLRK